MIHLRVHNHYSIKRGYGMNFQEYHSPKTQDPYVLKAKEMGMTHLALTNYANDHGFVNFWMACKKHEIQPIFGIEFMITNDMSTKGRPNFSHINYGNDTIILLAKNNQGYHDLTHINTIANKEEHYFLYPRIDYDFLSSQDVSNLICIVPYDFGTIPQYLMSDSHIAARRLGRMLKELFNDDLYFEISVNNSPVNREINQKVFGLAQQLEVECIVSSNVHYPNPEDKKVHDVLLALFQKKTYAEKDIYSLSADDHYFMSELEVKLGLHDNEFEDLVIERLISNTHKIAEQCTFNLEFPPLEIPDPIESGIIPNNFTTNEQYFRHLITEGWNRKILPRVNTGKWDEIKMENLPIYQKRLDYEVDMIKNMFTMKDPNHPAKEGFIPYFLIVRDYVTWAKGINRRIMHDAPIIEVGPARGSVSGSLAGYLIDLQDIDPIPYGLTFERFINPERVSWPDIDMDFHNEEAWWVERYLIETFGLEHVTHIITFQTMATKMSFDNVSKTLSGKYGKIMDKVKPENLKAPAELKKLLQMTKSEAEEFKNLMTDASLKDQLNPESSEYNPVIAEKAQLTAYQELFEIAVKLEGTISSSGSHPGAVVITKEPMWNHCSICNNGGKYGDDTILYVTSFEKYNMEEINTMKFDILRLRELVIVKNTLQFIKESTGQDIDLSTINPYDIESNLKILELLRKGDTDGIFQFSSHLYKGIIEEVLGGLDHLDQEQVAKDLFNIIVALEALGRPGPLEGGMVPRFAEFLAHPERAEKIHPVVDEILAETYSNMLYQEQIMFILMKLGGFSLGQADMVRRGIASGNVEKIEAQRGAYIEGVQRVQLEKKYDTTEEEMQELMDLANRIFDLMAKWAGYGFNKAHSVGYGILTLRGAWLKANYKPQFMAALMSANAGNEDKIIKYIDEIRSRGIKILPPKINKSNKGFTVVGADILFGLEAITGVGEKAIDKIIENYPYENFMDFIAKKVCNSGATRALIQGGYFDEDKRFLIKYWEALYEIREGKTRIEESLINFIVDQGIHQSTYGEIGQRIEMIIQEKIAKKRTEKTRSECAALVNYQEYSNIELLNMEKEVLGMYLSENPLTQFQDIIYGGTVLQGDFKDYNQKTDMFVIGIVIEEPKVILDKNKKQMAFVKLQMWDGLQECVVFHEPFAKYQHIIKEGNIIICKGKKGRNNGFVIERCSNLEEKQNEFREFFGIKKGVC